MRARCCPSWRIGDDPEQNRGPTLADPLDDATLDGSWDKAIRRGVRVAHHRLAIRNFGVPDEAHMIAILDTIGGAIAAGKTVYVHCLGGVGRTGTVVGCYLARHGAGGEEALRQVAALLGDGSPETEEQQRMVRCWVEGR